MALPSDDIARLESLGQAYRSVSAIGGFCFVLMVLMLIALPGMNPLEHGIEPGLLVAVVASAALPGLWGIVVGTAGRALCRRPTPSRLRTLRGLAWLALPYFPFGTLAAARTFWLLRRPALRAECALAASSSPAPPEAGP